MTGPPSDPIPSEPSDDVLGRVGREAKRRRRRLPLVVGAIGVALVLLGGSAWAVSAGLLDDDGGDAAAAATVASSTTEAPPTTEPRSSTTAEKKKSKKKAKPTTTTEAPRPQPEPFALPELPGGGLAQGARGEDVMVYELRLAALYFDPGPVDGVFDDATRQAVIAAQKLWGAERTGVIDEGVRFGLGVFQWPDEMVEDAEPDRVEVDLDRQVLLQYRGGDLSLISAVSTGSGKIFCGGHDGCQYATTPVGRYEFQWKWNGWRDGDLGRMYQPFYFNGGIAVHGYQSVPTTPASHGCVRIPMHIAEYFPDTVDVGIPIYVLGEQAAPFGKAPAASPPAATVPPPAPAPEVVAPPPEQIAPPLSEPVPTVPLPEPTVPDTTVPPPTVPTTQAPTTQAPTTVAPTTMAPTTVVPTTAAPPTT